MRATVEIASRVCVGSGMCELVAGALFRVNDDGIAEVVRDELTDDTDVNAATDAMNGCPSGAIEVLRS